MDSKEMARLLGKRGGKKNIELYGKDRMKEISAKGVAARRKKRDAAKTAPLQG